MRAGAWAESTRSRSASVRLRRAPQIYAPRRRNSAPGERVPMPVDSSHATGQSDDTSNRVIRKRRTRVHVTDTDYQGRNNFDVKRFFYLLYTEPLLLRILFRPMRLTPSEASETMHPIRRQRDSRAARRAEAFGRGTAGVAAFVHSTFGGRDGGGGAAAVVGVVAARLTRRSTRTSCPPSTPAGTPGTSRRSGSTRTTTSHFLVNALGANAFPDPGFINLEQPDAQAFATLVADLREHGRRRPTWARSR